MRGLKSFLMSGMMLCILYLVLQSTLLDDGTGTMSEMAQKIYSPFTFSTRSDAEDAQVEEEAPAPEPDTEAEPTPAPAPAAEASAPAPAEAPAPAAEGAAEPAPAKEEKETKETEEEKAPAPEEGKEEVIGFDTIDLEEPSGNWLAKRRIWERSQERYEQIKGVFDQVLEMRMPFFKRRAEIDRQILEPLYISVGLDREEITKILEEFTTLLTVDEEKHATLDEREKKMQVAAMEDRKILEELQADIIQLSKYETTLDSFLDRLMEQVNLGRTYEKQAWDAYKEIGKILNDKKARDLYIGMDTPFKRLSDISDYIKGIFKQEFDKVDTTIQGHATKIKDTLQSLKEKGLDLKQFSKQIDEKLRQEEAAAKEQNEAGQQEAPEEEGGIMATITSWFNTVVESIYSIYESIMSYFTGSAESEGQAEPVQKKSAVKKEVKKVEAPAAVPEKPAEAAAPAEKAETPAAQRA